MPALVEEDGLPHCLERMGIEADGGNKTITEKSDFSLMYASVPDEKSFRNSYEDPVRHEKEGGSWLIHALHTVVMDMRIKTISSLTLAIKRLVMEKEELDKTGTPLKQCPVLVDTLRYEVHF